MMPAPDDPTDAERYPTLSDHGRAILERMREHPSAPRFTNQSGNRLTATDVETVRAFEREVEGADLRQRAGERPTWLDGFVGRCYAEVPFFRNLGARPRDFLDVPTTDRGDLGRDIAQFVPDTAPVERLINFRTSGTTGHPLLLASHPVVAANYLAHHKRALRRFGIELRHGRGDVGVILLGFQQSCFTYVSVTPTMGESGLAKINLHPSSWRTPEDRHRYLDAMAPEVIAGDPISFAELLRLPVTCRPRALLSTSMALSPALAAELSARFGCPVLDLYSLNEAGPIAVRDEREGGHVLLQHRLFVEVLDRDGRPAPVGARGEVTLTGGFNFCLPLLRYRTGDHAAIDFDGPEPVLVDLEGRPPVRFRTPRGDWLNNIEVTHRLRRFSLPQFSLHQQADGALTFRFVGFEADAEGIRAALLELFGGAPLRVEVVRAFDGKVVQYTSALDTAAP